MGRKKQSAALDVYMNGEIVGHLQKEANGLVKFKYAYEWLETNHPISNSLPVTEEEYRGEEVNRYFDNLLPDNDEIRKKVAEKFGAESIRPFDMLEVIGRDCVGALSFIPQGEEPTDFREIKYSKLSEADIERKLKGLSTSSPLGMEENDDDFRLSIAGAQEKMALLKIDDEWCEPHGVTPTTHIFKTSMGALGLDINFDDSVENEWASLQILKKLGLNVCEANIETFGDTKVFVTKRFDRKWITHNGKNLLLRIPQEDMCQALGVSPYKKYQNEGGPGIKDIATFLRASNNQDDRLMFFKAQFIFDLLCATDGHAKNFSVFMEPNGFRLTPFYDVMSGHFLHLREKKSYEKLKLAMKVGNTGYYNFKKISLRHWSETAKICGLSEDMFQEMRSDLKKQLSSLAFNKKELPKNFREESLDLILEGMKIRSRVLLG